MRRKYFLEDKTDIINKKLSQIASNEEIQNYIEFFKNHNTLEDQIDWNLKAEDLKISIDEFINNFNLEKEKEKRSDNLNGTNTSKNDIIIVNDENPKFDLSTFKELKETKKGSNSPIIDCDLNEEWFITVNVSLKDLGKKVKMEIADFNTNNTVIQRLLFVFSPYNKQAAAIFKLRYADLSFIDDSNYFNDIYFSNVSLADSTVKSYSFTSFQKFCGGSDIETTFCALDWCSALHKNNIKISFVTGLAKKTYLNDSRVESEALLTLGEARSNERISNFLYNSTVKEFFDFKKDGNKVMFDSEVLEYAKEKDQPIIRLIGYSEGPVNNEESLKSVESKLCNEYLKNTVVYVDNKEVYFNDVLKLDLDPQGFVAFFLRD